MIVMKYYFNECISLVSKVNTSKPVYLILRNISFL